MGVMLYWTEHQAVNLTCHKHKGVRFPLLPQYMKKKKVKKFRIGDLLMDEYDNVGVIIDVNHDFDIYDVHWFHNNRRFNTANQDLVEDWRERALANRQKFM